MLVFISDLHFVDETAGKHNIATDAFRILPVRSFTKKKIKKCFPAYETWTGTLKSI